MGPVRFIRNGTDRGTVVPPPAWAEGGLDALHEVAGRTGLAVPVPALAWLLGRPGVTAPIVGARTLEQLETNLGAADLDLDPAGAALLTEASDQRLPYPYSVIETDPELR